MIDLAYRSKLVRQQGELLGERSAYVSKWGDGFAFVMNAHGVIEGALFGFLLV